MSSLDLSIEPSTIRSLSDEQKGRLVTVLDRYLLALADGTPPHRQSLLEEHADLAGPLTAHFDSIDEMHNAAAGFAGDRNSTRAEDETPIHDEKRLGDFRLLREIGHGGMGVVYEAQQVSLDRRVAVKVLPFASVLDSKQITRFKNEAQAAAQLDHPNIVPVYAVGSDRGVHFFAMQLIDGQPLDRAITEMRGLSAPATPPSTPDAQPDLKTAVRDTVARTEDADTDFGSTNRSVLTEVSADRGVFFRTVMGLGIQAAEALHAAHEYGVVHRDVKPSNLLLDGEGKLWVTDFGLARCQSDKNLTRTGDLIGTMRYMSPEQTQGQSAVVDQRTDIYSLGATLYELLALEPAFPGDDGPDLLRRLAEQDPRPLKQLQPKIPTDLPTVVHKAMARRREDRYATAQEFADDLRRVLDGKPTTAKPPTIADRVTKWTRRHQRLVIAAAVACLVAALGLATSTVLIAREKARTELNAQSVRRLFLKAQETVDCLGLQVGEQLAGVPGVREIRKDLLLTTRQYYREFVDEVKNDPHLRLDLALTYNKIGSLSQETGSNIEAIEAYESALAMLEQLVADTPESVEYRGQLAVCHNNLGSAYAQVGRTADARHCYLQAIRLQTSLMELAQVDSQYTCDLARSHTNLGLLLSEIGEPKAAEVSFLQAIQLQEELLKGDADNPGYLQVLGTSYNSLSTLYVNDDPDRAAGLYEKALTCQRTAAAARPSELKYRSDVALTYNNLGAVHSRMGRLAQAADSYGEAIQIQQDLLRAAPALYSYRRELAISFNNLGLTQSRLRQTRAAEETFQQALELQRQLVQHYPSDIGLSSSLGGIYNNLGIVSEELGKFTDAGTNYRKAVEHQRTAHLNAPNTSRYREFLSKHHYNYGRVMRRLGRPEEAVAAALARRELWPADPEHLIAVAEELALASTFLDETKHAEMTTERCIEAAIEILQQVVDAGSDLPPDLLARDSFTALRTNQQFAELVSR